MALDASPWDGDPQTPVCRSCGGLIVEKKAEVKIAFQHDPDGTRGLTGSYHKTCSKPFQSLARLINLRLI